MDWIGLDWIGLDWIGLDWIGLDWIGLDWIISLTLNARKANTFNQCSLDASVNLTHFYC
jgi:hypothetical protein